MKIVISGGGTGGHIFPAIAIADEIKKRYPGSEILFIGAKGKMEMKRVPKAGYQIKGLWISGIQRRLTWKNLAVPFKVLSSLIKARSILRKFKPDLVIGVGGYASGPTVYMASRMGIKTMIQEQNSYPGITNKLLGKRVDKICVAFDGMERFFPTGKLVKTGNPVRHDMLTADSKKREAANYFDWSQNKRALLVVGGSLGARTLNEALDSGQGLISEFEDCLVLWQVGRLYENRFKDSKVAKLPNVRFLPFIDRMDLAYALADVVISRAGALTIAELCVVGKPAVLVPSPNVAEDHQRKNALQLVEAKAALMVEDQEAGSVLLKTAFRLMDDSLKMDVLSTNIRGLGIANATEQIVDIVEKLISE